MTYRVKMDGARRLNGWASIRKMRLNGAKIRFNSGKMLRGVEYMGLIMVATHDFPGIEPDFHAIEAYFLAGKEQLLKRCSACYFYAVCHRGKSKESRSLKVVGSCYIEMAKRLFKC